MQLSLEDIEHLIASKESKSLEFKETTGQLTRGMETGCAFMNSPSGGYLLFGINDKGKIIGQEVSDKTQKEIAGALRRFEPTVLVDVAYVPIPAHENKCVIVIHFEDAFNKKPYLFDGRAYIKIESTTSVMSQEAYNELLMSRHKEQFRWEAYLNKQLSVEMFDKEKIIGTIRLGIENGRLPESTIENTDIPVLLDKLDLAENGVFKNAASVLFAKKTSNYFPQCKLRLARFRGTDRMEFIDNSQIEGNIFFLFDEAMAFLFKHLSLSGRINKFEREEELSIPYKALREAVINALCHRDYSILGGSVGIAIYDDRVEIINPGKLPKGIDINDITSPHKSIPNNPLIANVLYRRKMLESWGRGLELMYNECTRVGLPTPTLSDNEGEVVVTFYFKKQVTEQVTEQATEQVTEQVMALIHILSDKEMSIKEILKALNLKHRPTLLYDYIQPAMKLDIIEQTQPDSPKSPTQKYRLTDKGKKMI